jgi:hypothetical protein
MIKINDNTTLPETIELVPRKASKSVCFLGTVKAYPYIHINDFTNEEKTACWFNRKEMSEIKSDIRETIKFLCESMFITEDDSGTCSRGLEAFIPNKNVARRQRRRDAIAAVLHEQDTQWENHEPYDSYLIAGAYRQFTASPLSIAQKLAQKDEKFVLEEQEKQPRATRRNAICRKTSRSSSLVVSRQTSKRRMTTQGSIVCVQ